MFGVDIVAVATKLAHSDPAVCDRDELTELVTTSQRARGWLDALDARIALRAGELAEHGESEAASSVLTGGGRRGAREAQAAAQRGAVCAELPTVHDALADGEVSAGHVDALARLTQRLDDAARCELKTLETTLVESAKQRSVEDFTRECRDLERILSGDEGTSRLEQQKQARRLKRWIDRATGMCHTHLELDPETDAKVCSALCDAIATERAKPDDGRTWDQLQADALVGLITGAQTLDPRTPELTVIIDHHTLVDGLHDRSVCETGDGNPLPPETVRRLACDADILPVVLGAEGEVLDVGRAQRLATRAQRRALRAMYRTCAHPGCTVTFEQCRIHHVKPWEHGGLTDLACLIPLCSVHHHLVHEGGWTLTLDPDRTITLRRPDRTLHFHGTTVDRTPAQRQQETDPTADPTGTPAGPHPQPSEPTEPVADGLVDLFSWSQPAGADSTPQPLNTTVARRSRPPPTPAA